ncbi:putative High choriolytic enzyme 1 [Hypsibius exemplaris]|uniref:Metalloendopeptidase n=1 Tax=Hypsibius exemplaris TaxID=2072580 RepID=A0A1W0WWV5_HYPEX|nr:putative High choriolytic enzyme 1 [Hypsibius exemplaris]
MAYVNRLVRLYCCFVIIGGAFGAVIPGSWQNLNPGRSFEQDTPYHIISELTLGDRHQNDAVRNAIDIPDRRWANRTVAYTFAPEFTYNERLMIEQAQREIETGTCIRFVPRTNHYDYIEYVNGAGCTAIVGRQGGRQIVTLKRPNCIHHGTIVHEALHAMGFQHEQTRSDRDNWVTIELSNIIPEYQFAFEKEQTNNLNTPYDYYSVMHYGWNFFAIDPRRPTIVPKRAGVVLERGEHMTAIDTRRVRELYQCDGPNYTIDTFIDLTPGCASSNYFISPLPRGTTCSAFLSACGITLSELYRANPKLRNGERCRENLPPGTAICCRV